MPARGDPSSTRDSKVPGWSWRRAAWACVALIPAHASCQIYANSDWADGPIVLSNFKSAQTAAVLVTAPDALVSRAASGTTVSGPAAPTALVSAELRQLIEMVAERTEVSPRLIHAVILAESRYDPKAVSIKGAIGLMQLLPATARRFGAADPFAIDQNVAAGASYLKWLMGMFGDDLELVLAAYNAGEQAVLKAGRKIPPYPETQAYVRRIMSDLRRAPTLAM